MNRKHDKRKSLGRRVSIIGLLITTPLATADIVRFEGACVSFGRDSSCYGCNEGRIGASSGARESDAGLELQPNEKGWVIVDEIRVGLAYRAACSASVTIDAEVASPNDASSLRAYVSYGCDRVHWSDWLPPDGSKQYSGDGPPPLFCSDIAVKRRDAEYFKSQLEGLGEPEEGKARGTDAQFRWVAKRRPELFERVIPAIGYIRIKIVNPSEKAITLTRVSALISSHVSGFSRLGEPLDTETRWNFDLSAATSQPTSQPTTMPAAGSERGKSR